MIERNVAAVDEYLGGLAQPKRQRVASDVSGGVHDLQVERDDLSGDGVRVRVHHERSVRDRPRSPSGRKIGEVRLTVDEGDCGVA